MLSVLVKRHPFGIAGVEKVQHAGAEPVCVNLMHGTRVGGQLRRYCSALSTAPPFLMRSVLKSKITKPSLVSIRQSITPCRSTFSSVRPAATGKIRLRWNKHGELELTPHLVFRHKGFVQVGGENRSILRLSTAYACSVDKIFFPARRFSSFSTPFGCRAASSQNCAKQVVCCADLGRRQLFLPARTAARAQLRILPRRCLLGGLVCAVAAADTGGGQLARQIREVSMRVVECGCDAVTGLPVLETQDFVSCGCGSLG